MYDGKWYPAHIMFKHPKGKKGKNKGKDMGYKVHYYDKKGNEEANVSVDRIRPKAEASHE